MTDTELAWAAGLFEGEGTIRIASATGNTLGTLQVSVVSTDREVVEFFAARWPGYFKNATGLREHQRRAWVWVIAAKKAATFLDAVGPVFRTSRVKEKARLGLEFQGGKSNKWRVNTTQEYRRDQFNAYLWMRELNTRGVSRRVGDPR